MKEVLKEIKKLIQRNQIEDAIKLIDNNLEKEQNVESYIDNLVNDLK